MKKLVAAALVLGFVGIAAAGAVGVQRLSNGQCPLTGRPIHCLSSGGAAVQTLDAGPAACPMGMDAKECQENCPEPEQRACCRKRCEASQTEKPAQKP